MTESSDRTNNLPKTITFYQKANLLLRLAIITALLWPAFAIGSGVLLTPANAQTLVPLVTLSPLIPMVLFLLGAPYRYFLIAQDPDAKIGFRWAAAFIGVELAIGVYFAVIPVSNDPGLTPLLVLTASAIFFLRLAQVARWLRFLLVLLLIGITVIFIVGGRERIQAVFNSPNRVPVVRVPAQPQPLPHETGAQRRDVSPTTEPAAHTPVATQPAKAIPPITAGPVAVVKDADNYEFGFWPCRRVAAAVHCVGYVKNEYTEGATVWLTLSGLSDDQRNQYQAQSWSVYGGDCGTHPCYATLRAQESHNLSLKVDGVIPTAQSLTVSFHLSGGWRALGDVSLVVPITNLR